MLFVYPLRVIGTILGMFIRVDGKPQVCMFISIAGCILNIILDYVFVAAMGLGVQGSAIGTLIVQIVSVLIQFGYFMRKSTQIKFHSFAFDRKINREILLNGSSEFIGAAFTILGFVVYGYSMICIGFGQGISPLVSICRGAHEMEVAAENMVILRLILLRHLKNIWHSLRLLFERQANNW